MQPRRAPAVGFIRTYYIGYLDLRFGLCRNIVRGAADVHRAAHRRGDSFGPCRHYQAGVAPSPDNRAIVQQASPALTMRQDGASGVSASMSGYAASDSCC